MFGLQLIDKNLKRFLLSTYTILLQELKSAAKIHKKIIQNSKKIKIREIRGKNG